MQCKDLDTLKILNFKVFLAKMRALVRKGLVNGCTCGCKGNFELTEKGLKVLKAEREKRREVFEVEGVVVEVECDLYSYGDIQTENYNSLVAIPLWEKFGGKRVKITIEEV